jgi:hypothetical protein
VWPTHLVKLAVKTTHEFAEVLINCRKHPLPRFIPEPRIFALFLVFVLEGEIQVGDVRFPEDVVSTLLEWGGFVGETIEP